MQPLLLWKSNKYYIFWERIFRFRYLAWNAHAPYYIVIWDLFVSAIFILHYLINGKILGKKLLNTKCVFIFYTTFVWNISHSKKNWARCDQKIYIDLHVKYQEFLSYFNDTWIFSTNFLKIFKYQISWKSVQWGLSCSMWTDGRSDTTKLIIVLRNLANAPKTYIKCHKINANVSISLLFRHVPFKIAVKDGSNEI